MRLVPTVLWKLEGESPEALDARLLPLLNAVASSASLAAAVAVCGISYRAAWGLLRDYQRKLGEPLVLLHRGRGARLAPFGERLIGADKSAMQRLSKIVPGLGVEFDDGIRQAARGPLHLLRIVASHDLALAALAKMLPSDAGLKLDVSFTGSLHALREFADGRADLAGFHVPTASGSHWDRAPFLRGLQARRDRLIRFVDRDQGFILPRGNPAQVKRFRDIASQGLRFINRQRGSGTRLLIDQQTTHEKIDPADIVGYGNEEFTHPAVAATVASGGADAGFGLRAAAAEYRLAFVPLVGERYFLAVRARDIDKSGVARFIELLRSPSFARIARGFAGYRAESAGTVAGLDAIDSDGSR
jgi:molybdate transport repressor ModE-like protein